MGPYIYILHIYNYIQLIFGKKSPLCLHIITIHRLPQKQRGMHLGPWSHLSCRFFGAFSPSKPSWTWPAMWPHQTVLTWPGHLGGATAWGQQQCKTYGTKIDSRSWSTRWWFQMFLCSPPPGEMIQFDSYLQMGCNHHVANHFPTNSCWLRLPAWI